MTNDAADVSSHIDALFAAEQIGIRQGRREAVEALREYGHPTHRPDCGVWSQKKPKLARWHEACTCGLTETLRRLEGSDVES